MASALPFATSSLLADGQSVRALVGALEVPVMVADYSAVIARFADTTELAEELADPATLQEAVGLVNVLAVSPEWARLLGDPTAGLTPDLPMNGIDPTLHPEFVESFTDQVTAALTGVTSLQREHTLPGVHGPVTVRSYWRAPLVDGVARYDRVVIVDVDVTDLRRSQRRLEDTLEQRDRFMASVSHELRNALGAVSGLAAVLEDGWWDLPDEERLQMVSMLRSRSDDAIDMLTDILAAFRGSALTVASREVTLGSLLETIDLEGVSCEVDPELTVIGDQPRLRQVIRNLVTNAIRHGGERRRLVSRTDSGRIEVSMLDDGPGPPDSLADTLFEPFAHGDDPGSTGLGLSVSKALAEAMGGDLTFERRNGWTVFTLSLVGAG